MFGRMLGHMLGKKELNHCRTKEIVDFKEEVNRILKTKSIEYCITCESDGINGKINWNFHKSEGICDNKSIRESLMKFERRLNYRLGSYVVDCRNKNGMEVLISKSINESGILLNYL